MDGWIRETARDGDYPTREKNNNPEVKTRMESQWNTYGTEFIKTDFTITILISIDDGLKRREAALIDSRQKEATLIVTLSTICCNWESFKFEPTIIFNTWNNSPRTKKRMCVDISMRP